MQKWACLNFFKSLAICSGGSPMMFKAIIQSETSHGRRAMKKIHSGILFFFLFLIVPAMLVSCAGTNNRTVPDAAKAYVAEKALSLTSRFAPVFVTENHQQPYNRIGMPSAVTDDSGEMEIVVNPDQAAIYAANNSFQTTKGVYTNLIYRIHFEKVPFDFIPFQIGSGNNVGLIVVVTLNDQEKPVLFTTVHTCGCYLAFTPTSYLPEHAFPPQWSRGRQEVYSENLPGFLEYQPSSSNTERLMILLRDASHRVKDMWLSDDEQLTVYDVFEARLYPLEALEKLPLENGRTTSFYEVEGPRRGYVKGSHKIWERLLISWWAFDWRVGEDKKLGKDKNDGILFYTSLKPWARTESDMRDFASFLKYWGWRL